MDCRGALYWPEERVLVIADLHLEKGSSFARRGVLLPPYDTAESLARIAGVIARFAPRVVIALGDSFHDKKGSARIASADRSALVELQRGRDWIWIVGNHDPVPAAGIGGSFGA
ncbi:MAG: metallophosphoesterase, partial [Xanthobacteraceae bacterium]